MTRLSFKNQQHFCSSAWSLPDPLFGKTTIQMIIKSLCTTLINFLFFSMGFLPCVPLFFNCFSPDHFSSLSFFPIYFMDFKIIKCLLKSYIVNLLLKVHISYQLSTQTATMTFLHVSYKCFVLPISILIGYIAILLYII